MFDFCKGKLFFSIFNLFCSLLLWTWICEASNILIVLGIAECSNNSFVLKSFSAEFAPIEIDACDCTSLWEVWKGRSEDYSFF